MALINLLLLTQDNTEHCDRSGTLQAAPFHSHASTGQSSHRARAMSYSEIYGTNLPIHLLPRRVGPRTTPRLHAELYVEVKRTLHRNELYEHASFPDLTHQTKDHERQYSAAGKVDSGNRGDKTARELEYICRHSCEKCQHISIP